MSNSKPNAAAGTDWTGLLADPVLAKNLGKLLKTYRDAPPERRDEALLAAMREIKSDENLSVPTPKLHEKELEKLPQAVPAVAAPPFVADLFSPNWGQDRRRYLRIKCFVAVELRVNDAETPIWGNLSNTSLGGCQVETAHAIKADSKVELGLWVASGKIWVKGFALNGIITRSTTQGGVRVRFDGMNSAEKENLRQFLKYVQETTRASRSENSYLQLLK